MPQGLVRKSIWALGAAAVVAVLVIVALPMIASTQIVRDRIALEMSAWSGYRVEFGQAPVIELWPFRAVLSDVRFSDWQDEKRSPVIEAERIEVSLSALAALGGDAVFSNARLLRPIVHVTPSGGLLYAPDLPASGRIADSITIARDALAANPTQPDLTTLPRDSFGTVEFVDGQVVVARGTSDLPVMTSLAGSIRWPALHEGAVLAATAIWRGESVAIDAVLGQPLLLFAGGASALTASLKATPIAATFEGKANLSSNSFFDGQLSVSSPSLRRMLEWSASEVVASSATGSFSLSGHALGDSRRLKVEDAELALDGNPGNGLLEFTFGQDAPGVAGTLAFENIDLASFLYAFTPLSPGDAGRPVTINPSTIDRLGLDLRVSANRASVGGVVLADVAATSQARGNVTDFDISDASAFGGRIQTGVRYDRARDGGYLEVKLMASDFEAGTVAKALWGDNVAPAGRATVSVLLKGAGHDWDSFMQNAEGNISAGFGPGTIAGFDLTAFLSRIREGGFFPLSDVSGGSLPVERAELKATVAAGLARVETATIATQSQTIALMGIVPHVERGLALSGFVSPKPVAGQPAPEPEARFFVGGAWSAPFVSPVVASVTAAPAAGN